MEVTHNEENNGKETKTELTPFNDLSTALTSATSIDGLMAFILFQNNFQQLWPIQQDKTLKKLCGW